MRLKKANIFIKLLPVLLFALFVMGQESECPSIQITSEAPIKAFLGATYSYTPVVITNPPVGSAKWTKVSGPSTMKVDAKTGTVGWSPVDLPGDYKIKIQGTFMGETVTQEWKLFVGLMPDINPKTTGGSHSGTVKVTVFDNDSGDPLADTFVMIGRGPDDPFTGNWGFTKIENDAATISFSNVPTGPYELTVAKKGYIYFSIYLGDAAENEIGLTVAHTGLPDMKKVSGNLTQYSSPPSGSVFAGFVTQELSVDQIASFDINAVLAPNSTMKVFGIPVQVPGNVVIPKQTGLEQPYTIKVLAGEHHFSAVGGTIKSDELTALINEGITELGVFIAKLLQKMSITESGLVTDVAVSGNMTGVNIPMSEDLKKTINVTVKNAPTGLDVTSAALMEWPFEGFFPTGFDIFLAPDTLSTNADIPLALTTASNTGVFDGMPYNVIVSASDISGGSDQSTIVLLRDVKRDEAITVESFFKPVKNMRVSGNKLTFTSAYNGDITPPSPVPNFSNSKMSLIQLVPNPEDSSQMILVFNKLWEFYAPGQWTNPETGAVEDLTSINLPTFPTGDDKIPPSLQSGQPYLWELRVSHMNAPEKQEQSGTTGVQEDPQFQLNDFEFKQYINLVTHAANNSIAFFR
jgi:hypothetical protein